MKKEALINISIKKKHIYFLSALIILFTAIGFSYAIDIDPAIHGHPDNGPLHIVGDRIGIGTDSPARELQINEVGNSNTHSASIRLLKDYSDQTSGGSGIRFDNLDTALGGVYGSADSSGVGGGLRLYSSPDGIDLDPIVFITKPGNVGIGTTDPQQKLQVLGNIAQIRQANTIEAKNELKTMPDKTTMMPRNWNGQLYFYWKGGDGKMYEAMIVGTEIP